MNIKAEDHPYLVEGIVEEDPLTGQCTIRTEDQLGKPFSFDPQMAFLQFKGREVRFVLVPLATIAQLEEAQRQLDEAEKGN